MRLLVCGSRDWSDAARFCREMDRLMPNVVIHGACPTGSDDMAGLWADLNVRVTVHAYIANWSRDGKAAGPLRNARMLREGKPDRGLAFGALWKPGEALQFGELSVPTKPRHTGTGGMVRLMLSAGLPVRWVASPDAVAVDLREMPEAGR